MTKHPRIFRPVVFAAILTGIALAAFLISPGSLPSTSAFAQSMSAEPHCVAVGGTVMTNLGVVGQSTTLGIIDGDLKGAVAATILNVAPGSGGTTIFTVQHHFVTLTGDTIFSDPATATTKEVVPGLGLYAVISYPLHIKGGTGKFAGATGDLTSIGEVDINAGHTVFRCGGQVCFATPADQ